jgi:type II secretory ATPase GspE/PulE/Tfp pilus assembly ATPase PilB-like protein
MNAPDTMTEKDFEELSGEVELNTPEDFARALIGIAIDMRANDIFITDDAVATSVKFRHLGKIREIRRLTHDYGRRLHNHFRALAEADLADLHRPSEGRILFPLEDRKQIDLRISTLPSLFGHDLSIRLADIGQGAADLEDLGLLDDEQHELRRLLDSPSGLILVAGPTGSGKTHSLYAFLRHLNNGNRKIHTLEDPIERVVRGAVQTQVSRRSGMDFSDLLHAVLRHSPDVIMIGEIRDNRTAEIAVRAASSGQLVLATLHSQTAAGAVDTMLAYGTHRRFLASNLVGVIAQRLVRRLCPECRNPIFLPHATGLLSDARAHLKSLRLQNGAAAPQLFRTKGCKECQSEGYDRLVCVPEIMVGTSRIRNSIASGESSEQTHQVAISQGMRTLREAGQLRIAMGHAAPNDVYEMLPPLLDRV